VEQGDAVTITETDEHEADKTRIIRKTTPAFAWLVGIGGRSEDKRFDVSDEVTTIGRSPANTIVLDGDSVSKEHAKIKYYKDEDVFKIHDLVSTNGTFVEGVRVEAPIILQDGSKVEFGEEPLVFKRVSIRKAKRASDQG
jgi:pSer/pThr/pTyr-binding forkhead associated (FHA) protein